MDLEALRALAAALLLRRKAHIDREKGFIYYHGQRVAKTVILLRRAIVPDDSSHDDILAVAAWFHDIGKDIEPHARYGAVLAREALREHCLPEELDEICRLIAAHCDRGNPGHDDWVKLLQDADLLDHFGTQDIRIGVMADAYKERSPEQVFAWIDEHWQTGADRNRSKLNYSFSLRIFDEKVAFSKHFYERMRVECAGDIVIT